MAQRRSCERREFACQWSLALERVDADDRGATGRWCGLCVHRPVDAPDRRHSGLASRLANEVQTAAKGV